MALPGGQLHQHVGLSTILKRMQEVGCGNQITVFVDEEGIPIKKVVISLFGRSFIKRINNRANRFREISRVLRLLSSLGRPEAREKTHCNDEANLHRAQEISDGNLRWHGKLRRASHWLVKPWAGTSRANHEERG